MAVGIRDFRRMVDEGLGAVMRRPDRTGSLCTTLHWVIRAGALLLGTSGLLLSLSYAVFALVIGSIGLPWSLGFLALVSGLVAMVALSVATITSALISPRPSFPLLWGVVLCFYFVSFQSVVFNV